MLTSSVPVLRLTDGSSQLVVGLDDQGRYVYSYANSVYQATVEERHIRLGDRLSITSVRSPDLRAVEYFRWEGEPRRVDDAYDQSAPPNSAQRLTIRVTAHSQQRVAGERWAVDLAERFGEGLVRVSAERLPLIVAVIEGWRP